MTKANSINVKAAACLASGNTSGRHGPFTKEQALRIESYFDQWHEYAFKKHPDAGGRGKSAILTKWKQDRAKEIIENQEFSVLPDGLDYKETITAIVRKFTNWRNAQKTHEEERAMELELEALKRASTVLMEIKAYSKGRDLFKQRKHPEIVARKTEILLSGEISTPVGAYQRAWKKLWDEADQDEWERRRKREERRYSRIRIDSLPPFSRPFEDSRRAVVEQHATHKDIDSIKLTRNASGLSLFPEVDIDDETPTSLRKLLQVFFESTWEHSHPGDLFPPWDELTMNPSQFYDEKLYDLEIPIANPSNFSTIEVCTMVLCLGQLTRPFAFRQDASSTKSAPDRHSEPVDNVNDASSQHKSSHAGPSTVHDPESPQLSVQSSPPTGQVSSPVQPSPPCDLPLPTPSASMTVSSPSHAQSPSLRIQSLLSPPVRRYPAVQPSSYPVQPASTIPANGTTPLNSQAPSSSGPSPVGALSTPATPPAQPASVTPATRSPPLIANLSSLSIQSRSQPSVQPQPLTNQSSGSPAYPLFSANQSSPPSMLPPSTTSEAVSSPSLVQPSAPHIQSLLSLEHHHPPALRASPSSIGLASTASVIAHSSVQPNTEPALPETHSQLPTALPSPSTPPHSSAMAYLSAPLLQLSPLSPPHSPSLSPAKEKNEQQKQKQKRGRGGVAVDRRGTDATDVNGKNTESKRSPRVRRAAGRQHVNQTAILPDGSVITSRKRTFTDMTEKTEVVFNDGRRGTFEPSKRHKGGWFYQRPPKGEPPVEREWMNHDEVEENLASNHAI